MRLLEAVAVLVAAGEAFAAAPTLERIEVLGGQAPAVRLHLSARAAVQARSLPASGDVPDRVYVDLAGTTLAPAVARVLSGSGGLLRVRAGQFDRSTARVVLDVARAVPFHVRQSDTLITIELEVPGRAPPPAAQAVPASPAQSERSDAARAAPPRSVPAPHAPALPPAAAATAPVAPPPPAAAATAPVAPSPTPAPAERATTATPPPPPGDAAAQPAAVAEGAATAVKPPPPAATAPLEPAEPAVAQPEPEPPVHVPPLPSLFPSFGALPGALIALQNGRPVPPAASQRVVSAPARAPSPTEAPSQRIVPAPAPPPPARAEPPAAVAAAPPATPAPSQATQVARAPEPAAPSAPAVQRAPLPAASPPRRVPAATPHPLVVLDAGHGGRDPGAEGVGGILEKDVVLEITRLVARRLTTRLPVDVVMTRSDDSFIPIERRLALPGEGATLFISLHANACTDPTARGLEVFFGGGAVRPASTHGGGGPAALLGRYLKDALDARIGGVRGAARPGDFGVLVRNPVPSALIEIGYLTHPAEAARAQDTAFHELVADAVVQGVGAFLRASAPPL
jgi:N-acetylmuramoyl-L-alanine amidase